jgi:D-beta-D-heptose 7-phosphate kinase/D-beta-D-heptose 1-phosphate adenosyltransferase
LCKKGCKQNAYVSACLIIVCWRFILESDRITPISKNVKILMLSSLPKQLPEFTNASVLVVGDIMLDRYWFGDAARISPEAPVPVVNVSTIDHRPGGAGNVALNIASLGVNTHLLGITGQDEAAHILEQQLAAANVDLHLCQDQSVQTIVKLRVISRHQQLIRLDFETCLPDTTFPNLLKRFQSLLSRVNLVVLSDYKKGTLHDVPALIAAAKAAGLPIIVDPKGTDFNRYRHASIMTPNFKEFEAVVGPCKDEQAILDKGRALLKQFEIETLLITRSEQGMTLITIQDAWHLPAVAREVIDVTGAGDTVISVLGAAIAAGAHVAQSAALANMAASIAVGKLGAATVSQPELQVALTGQSGFVSGIVNEEQLLSAVTEAHLQGKRVVFTNGCFDVLHAGHVLCLQMAKQLGDYLIVAVNTDESVRQLKGPNRPVNHLEHRMTVLAGLGVVDWVVPFHDETPERLLTLLRPDVLVKGGEYRLDQVVGANIVLAYGGDVRILGNKISSSTSIIDRIKCSQQQLNQLSEVTQDG